MSLSLGRHCPTARQEGEAEHLGSTGLAMSCGRGCHRHPTARTLLGSYTGAGTGQAWGPCCHSGNVQRRLALWKMLSPCPPPPARDAWMLGTTLGAQPSGSTRPSGHDGKDTEHLEGAERLAFSVYQAADPEQCHRESGLEPWPSTHLTAGRSPGVCAAPGWASGLTPIRQCHPGPPGPTPHRTRLLNLPFPLLHPLRSSRPPRRDERLVGSADAKAQMWPRGGSHPGSRP